jgi:AbrB family looped-hinge helix DNA binding protein
MIVTKLTGKYQTTVPAPVRRVLDLHTGDSVVFEVAGDRVFLRKALPMDVEYLRSLETTLCEWVSENDEEAYRGL